MEYKTGPDNVGFMQTLLKTEFPEFALVVKELYSVGLIDGLRGLTITTECKQSSAPLINAQTEKPVTIASTGGGISLEMGKA